MRHCQECAEACRACAEACEAMTTLESTATILTAAQ
ncbi:four-helix bundle copper-binding protein [Variovorax sp. KK3]|nr:four-helix bundle copper-binding protein [Variovorax sp. KK3]